MSNLERVGVLLVADGASKFADALGSAARAVVDFIGEGIDMAADYEQSMNVLQAQSGATDAQMDQLRQTARDLGADLTLPGTSAVDAGQAMLELSKGGLEVDQAMAAAKGTLQLAAAAETDVATAANITTGALSAFGLEGSKAGYIADVLANSANLSRASITDMSQGFQQAAFRFHSAGQGADDLAASLVILTKNGLSGSDSGTALQNMLGRLQGPTDKAAKLMAELGINVYDAAGNMRPMPDIIGIFNEKLGGMTQEERNAALNTIFLSDGMKAMIPLLDAGADGFLKTRDAVNEQGAAARLAEAQMKGLKGATEGLTSQIETLALEALEPLLPLMAGGIRAAAEFAGSFSGKVGPAVKGVIGFIGDAAEIVQDAFVPAIAAAATILLGYSAAALAPLLVNMPALTAVIIYQTGAWLANAAAVALAALPIVAIGAAVGVTILAFNKFNEKIEDATTQLLESRKWWTDSGDAIERYGQQTGEAVKQLGPAAATIQAIRDMIEEETASLGRRMAAGDVSEAQYAEEIATINQHKDGLIQATNAYNLQEQAIVKATTSTITATAKTDDMAASQGNLQTQLNLTVEDMERLATEFSEIMTKGAAALGTLATTHANFVQGVEQKQAEHEATMDGLIKEHRQARTEEERHAIEERIVAEQNGYDEQLLNAAKAYAEQAAAQRQALGEQLLAYIENQRQMGNISNEKAQEIREKTITHFGIMRDSAAALFGEMAMSVDGFAQDAGASADDVARSWGQTEDAAVKLREKANELKDRYEMEIVADFQAGRITVDEARKALADVPRRVESEIVITTTRRERDLRGDDPSQNAPGRALGGPVEAGRAYLVGERRPEVFVPEEDGRVMPSIEDYHRTVAPPASAAQMASTAYNNTRTQTINMPIYTNQSPAVLQQSWAVMQASMP